MLTSLMVHWLKIGCVVIRIKKKNWSINPIS